MDKLSGPGEAFDISVWYRKYTYDAVGTLFYGKDEGFGFIRDEMDYNGWMNLLDQMPPTVSSLAYLPWDFQTLYMMWQMLWPET
jgi:hypothetical protein